MSSPLVIHDTKTHEPFSRQDKDHSRLDRFLLELGFCCTTAQVTTNEIFVVQPISTVVSHSRSKSPADPTEKFSTTVSDVVPRPIFVYVLQPRNHLKERKRPPHLPLYRMNPKIEKECQAIVTDFINKCFIEPNKSPIS